MRQVDPSRLPGHAERLMAAAASAASDFAGDNDSNDPPRPLSEDEAQKLDQECHERFIKVNVKHITDGQVSYNHFGLLATPAEPRLEGLGLPATPCPGFVGQRAGSCTVFPISISRLALCCVPFSSVGL